MDDRAADVLQAARARGWMIATAESCTGGLLSAALTSVAGSSDVFDRGFVTYSYASKSELLGVPVKLVETHGAVSEDVAIAMANGALAASNAQIAISITGVAGPGASEAKPEGLVCFALAVDGAPALADTQKFGPLGRGKVRSASVRHALGMLLTACG